MTSPTDVFDELPPFEIALAAVSEPLRSLIEMANESAENRFRQIGHTIPQWRAITAQRELLLIADPPAEDKDVSAMLVRGLLEIKNATSVVFSDEAWVFSISNDGKPMTPEQVRESEHVRQHGVRNHPQRAEAIIFICEDHDGHYYHGQRTITRPKHGKAKLGPLHLYRPKTGEGRCVAWLTPKGKPS